jgi:hypothetical protein
LIGEDLRNPAPTDVFYEDAFFIFGCFTPFPIEFVGKLDGREVVPALLFQRTVPERILRSDAIVARV